MDSVLYEDNYPQAEKHWSWTLFFVFLMIGIILSGCFWYLNHDTAAVIIIILYVVMACTIAQINFFLH